MQVTSSYREGTAEAFPERTGTSADGERDLTCSYPSVTVVICAYSTFRWSQIVSAVESVRRQTVRPTQCVLVIDHNPELLERAKRLFTDVIVIPNAEGRGLSGGRNSGVRAAASEVVAFLDDDAEADETWLARLLEPYSDAAVIGTGGSALARWPQSRPSWFPAEFDWVVGCSYRGLPEQVTPVRNPIGANMSFRSEAFGLGGGFDQGIGRLGKLPLGCEETVFSIRVRHRAPQHKVVYVPDARVWHAVSPDRITIGYFVRRCVAEGISKAAVASYVGQTKALESERQYVVRTLSSGFLKGMMPRGGSDASPARSLMIVVGLAATSVGYALGRMQLQRLAGALIGRGQ